MILAVFEGAKTEPKIFGSLCGLFLRGEEVVAVSYNKDLPTLYKHLKDTDYDLFRVLPFEDIRFELPTNKRIDTLFSQIFLFFDYDFQNRLGVERLNPILGEMLDYFDDETINGKLYINYPMVESLKYIRTIPDPDYWRYSVPREDCKEHRFKGEAEAFACRQAKAFRFIDHAKTPAEVVRDNWKTLIQMNISKANYIVANSYTQPKKKSDIGQAVLFKAQVEKYVQPLDSVSILNSFPLFLYDYLA